MNPIPPGDDKADTRVGDDRAILQEANQQLVMALLRAQAHAEKAKRKLEAAVRLATLDATTLLPRRVLLFERLAKALATAQPGSLRAALLFVGLDNLRQINQTLGRAAGDRALLLAAQRLATSAGASGMVSRYGGNEFLVLILEAPGADQVAAVAAAMSKALAAPCQVDGHPLDLTASIGISLCPDDGQDAGRLVERASAALYSAKVLGSGRIVFAGAVPEATAVRVTDAPGLSGEASIHDDLARAELEQPRAQLQEANRNLILAVLGARDRQDAAESAQHRQTNFLGVLAHELRNPLGPISNAAAILGRMSSDEGPLLASLQALIERQVAQMSRLISDLLDATRASTGKFRLQLQVLDMAGVIDEAGEAFRSRMESRRQDFTIHRQPGPLPVSGDPARLAQVLGNLLDNASKYTPEGGEITLSAAVVGEQLVITVTDNGIGIRADALTRVFEPFVQDEDATDFDGVGLGIGLSVVRELVAAHGGTVEASSAGTGKGSRFTVRLKLLPQEPQPATSPA